MKKIAIIGSGLTGCLTAIKIAKKYKNFKIYLIEGSNKICPSFSSIKLKNFKINNGFHAIEISRCEGLYKFLKYDLKINFKTNLIKRFIVLDNFFEAENYNIEKMPKKLQKCFKQKKIVSDNINYLFNNLSGSIKKNIKSVSTRYSKNLKDNLSFFIPWFLPKEYTYISKDEGTIYRNKQKKSGYNGYVAVPKNHLFEIISSNLKKEINKMKNVNLILNSPLDYSDNKIRFVKNNENIQNNFDYIFICTPPTFILKSLNHKLFTKLISNKKYFVSCLIKLNKKINFLFTEIIFSCRKFKELCRLSKVKMFSKDRNYLIEFYFDKKDDYLKKINNDSLFRILKFISINNKKNIHIIEKKITRNIFFPNLDILKKCRDEIKKEIKYINKNKKKIFCTSQFGPINMSKAWIESEKNLDYLKRNV